MCPPVLDSLNSHLHLRIVPPKDVSRDSGLHQQRGVSRGANSPARPGPPCAQAVWRREKGDVQGAGGEHGHSVPRCPPQEREVRGQERVQGPRVSAGIGSLQMTVSGKTFQANVENSGRSSRAGQSTALHLSPAQAGFSLHDPVSYDPVLPKTRRPSFRPHVFILHIQPC